MDYNESEEALGAEVIGASSYFYCFPAGTVPETHGKELRKFPSWLGGEGEGRISIVKCVQRISYSQVLLFREKDFTKTLSNPGKEDVCFYKSLQPSHLYKE